MIDHQSSLIIMIMIIIGHDHNDDQCDHDDHWSYPSSDPIQICHDYGQNYHICDQLTIMIIILIIIGHIRPPTQSRDFPADSVAQTGSAGKRPG